MQLQVIHIIAKLKFKDAHLQISWSNLDRTLDVHIDHVCPNLASDIYILWTPVQYCASQVPMTTYHDWTYQHRFVLSGACANFRFLKAFKLQKQATLSSQNRSKKVHACEVALARFKEFAYHLFRHQSYTQE